MERKAQVKLKKVKLKEVRKKLELTQEQAAERLKIERADLSRLETGKRIPDWFFKAIELHKLLQDAGYSLDDLAIPPYEDERS